MDAVKTGPWSDPATWDGVQPTVDDVAHTAGHQVTIDQNVTVRRLDTTGGGYFVTTGNVTITVTEPAVSNGEAGTYVLGVNDGDTVTFRGPAQGGTGSLRHGILLAGGDLTIHGDLTGGSTPNAFAVWQIGGTLTVHGRLYPAASEPIRTEAGELRLDATWPLGPVPPFTGTTPVLIQGDYLAVAGAGENGSLILSAGRKLPAKVQSWPPRPSARRSAP